MRCRFGGGGRRRGSSRAGRLVMPRCGAIRRRGGIFKDGGPIGIAGGSCTGSGFGGGAGAAAGANLRRGLMKTSKALEVARAAGGGVWGP